MAFKPKPSEGIVPTGQRQRSHEQTLLVLLRDEAGMRRREKGIRLMCLVGADEGRVRGHV